ncbi:MAG: peptidoglycan-binding protein [Roseiarcus sp.]|uniref:peptidoglycan-binding protein n=1 Tax=Roseiarcus sp. TaxID=1969460 RepID=UPI003C3D6278
MVIARAIAALTILLAAGRSADAQPPPTSASSADAALAAQKATFLALPESTRKAAQDALVWLGFYNGVVDGDFGRGTRNAILAYQASVKAPQDGALSAPEIKALLASAQKARDAVGFQIVKDAKTGASIGAPTKLIGAHAGAKLVLAASPDADLDALYARLAAVTPARKIAYKAIKPDSFFVVSGQDGASNFYTRFDKNAAASPPIRGFTFAYPSSQAAQLDRVAIAVANSFEPFPQVATTPAASTASGAVAPASSAAPPAPNPSPAATALVVAPGLALTALKADDCPNPTVDGKPVRVERTDAATNLAMIAGDFGPKGEPPRFGAPGPDVVVLGFAGPRLAASPASLSGGEARPAIVAAVEASGGGGPVFDRRGALVGLVAPIEGAPKRVAGVALAASHAVIAPDAIRAFLGASESAPVGAADLSAGDIVAREKEALLALYCGS